jgi:arylsulfatase A-like enzyme
LNEGGLRVPTTIEWPARIKQPRTSLAPCSTVDIYPTLLDIVGVEIPNQPSLDGISLLPLIDGQTIHRDKPLGFWVFPERGISTPSTRILQQMLAQQQGDALPENGGPAFREPGKITKQYPEDVLPGPSAWIDGDYKLHRKANKSGEATYSLHNLVKDPTEQTDLSAGEPARLEKMKAGLEAWQKSVIRSLNGEDYF